MRYFLSLSLWRYLARKYLTLFQVIAIHKYLTGREGVIYLTPSVKIRVKIVDKIAAVDFRHRVCCESPLCLCLTPLDFLVRRLIDACIAPAVHHFSRRDVRDFSKWHNDDAPCKYRFTIIHICVYVDPR